MAQCSAYLYNEEKGGQPLKNYGCGAICIEP